jgi:glycosyltransferase involved in cell wall biosynthesis
MIQNPEIYVVTVVYNGELTIERTIKSVISQNYNNYKYLVIDGKSTDRTLDIIKKYSHCIDTIISDKDRGIYDAMNKAINLIYNPDAFVLFINSDDFLISNQILSDVSVELLNSEFIYGKVNLLNSENNQFYPAGSMHNYQTLPYGMIQHQATFVKRNLFNNNLFDLKYSIAADYDFAIKIFLSKNRTKFIDRTISVMTMGGISRLQAIKSFKEKKEIIRKYYFGKVRIMAIAKINFVEIPRYLIFFFLTKVKLIKLWRVIKMK